MEPASSLADPEMEYSQEVPVLDRPRQSTFKGTTRLHFRLSTLLYRDFAKMSRTPGNWTFPAPVDFSLSDILQMMQPKAEDPVWTRQM